MAAGGTSRLFLIENTLFLMNNQATTENHQLMRQRILEAAENIFKTQGIRSMTMDTLSKQLHMSKRTVYMLFADKEELVISCLKEHLEREQRFRDHVRSETNSALECMLRHAEYKINELRKFTPVFFEDCEKSPRIKAFMQQQGSRFNNEMQMFMQAGISQGYFRTDINYSLVVNTLFAFSSRLNLADIFSLHTVDQVICNVYIVFFRGCATPKGIEIIDKFLKKYTSTY